MSRNGQIFVCDSFKFCIKSAKELTNYRHLTKLFHYVLINFKVLLYLQSSLFSALQTVGHVQGSWTSLEGEVKDC